MLNIQHAGIWNLSPIAGPYNSMYGELNIQELIDGYTVVPYCDFTFGVTGYATEDLCETCDFGFSIDFFVLEPEPPEEGEEEEDSSFQRIFHKQKIFQIASVQSYPNTKRLVPWRIRLQMRCFISTITIPISGFHGTQPSSSMIHLKYSIKKKLVFLELEMTNIMLLILFSSHAKRKKPMKSQWKIMSLHKNWNSLLSRVSM